jgi:hypothetical protein
VKPATPVNGRLSFRQSSLAHCLEAISRALIVFEGNVSFCDPTGKHRKAAACFAPQVKRAVQKYLSFRNREIMI